MDIEIEVKFQIDLTASKPQCRRVWTSFGISMALLPFFTSKEVLQDQLLNMFFYDIGISRV